MEMKNMKTNKTIVLTLALATAIFAQPAHGMHAQKSLANVSCALLKIEKYWKPVAGTAAVAAGCYLLWSMYTAPSSSEKDMVLKDGYYKHENIDGDKDYENK